MLSIFSIIAQTLALSLDHIGVKPKIKFDGQRLKRDKVTFTRKGAVNIYIVYDINLLAYTQGADIARRNSLIRAVKLTKNTDSDKYKYLMI